MDSLLWEEVAFVPYGAAGSDEAVRTVKDLGEETEEAIELSDCIESVAGIEPGTPTAQACVANLVEKLLMILDFTSPGQWMRSSYAPEDTVEMPGINYLGESIPAHRDYQLLSAADGKKPLLWMVIHPDREARQHYAEKRLISKALEGMHPRTSVILGLLMLDMKPIFYRISRVVDQDFEFLGVFKVEKFDPKYPGLAMEDPMYREKIANYLVGFRALHRGIVEQYDRFPEGGGLKKEEMCIPHLAAALTATSI